MTVTAKRLVSAALALSLLGTTAASAQPYRHGGYDRGYHHGGNGAGALIGLGIGLFALGAIAASQHDHERYYDRYEYGPPPPPPAYYDRGYGWSRGYRY